MTTLPLFCQKRIDLTSDKSFTKVFNQTEIQGLESMVQYTDNMVLNRENKTDADEAYHLFFEEIAQTPEYIDPFEENVKYKFLESLDSSAFSAIWRFETHIDVISYRDTVYRNLENFKTLNLKPFSKYMDYLEEVGKDDSYFKSLRKLMEDVGALSAQTSHWFPKNHTNFDFNIPKNRLWATIFLLSREENYERKLDRYFENK